MLHAIYSRHGKIEDEPFKTYAEAEGYLCEGDGSNQHMPVAIYDDATGQVWLYGRAPAGVEQEQMDRQALEAIRTAFSSKHEPEVVGYFPDKSSPSM